MIDQSIQSRLKRATDDVQRFLPLPQKLTPDEARQTIRRYTAAFEGNFLAWMGGASIAARSPYGRYAADENLQVELRDDHPGLLRRFARSAGAEPDVADFRYVEEEVLAIRQWVGACSGLKNLSLMGVLENTSLFFIPYLTQLAVKLEATDHVYLEIHGEADMLHADQFAVALSEEQQWGYSDAANQIDATIDVSLTLLKKIFSVAV